MDESSEDYILYYEYRDPFVPKNSFSDVETYKGAKKDKVECLSVKEGVGIPFNTLFIDEHTTPVADVIKVLKCKCGDEPCEKDIIEILDKIHLTKMTRMENRGLSPSSGRISPSEYINTKPEDILDIINSKCRSSDTPRYPKLKF